MRGRGCETITIVQGRVGVDGETIKKFLLYSYTYSWGNLEGSSLSPTSQGRGAWVERFRGVCACGWV